MNINYCDEIMKKKRPRFYRPQELAMAIIRATLDTASDQKYDLNIKSDELFDSSTNAL